LNRLGRFRLVLIDLRSAFGQQIAGGLV
jgi:hypothetical protein